MVRYLETYRDRTSHVCFDLRNSLYYYFTDWVDCPRYLIHPRGCVLRKWADHLDHLVHQEE